MVRSVATGAAAALAAAVLVAWASAARAAGPDYPCERLGQASPVLVRLCSEPGLAELLPAEARVTFRAKRAAVDARVGLLVAEQADLRRELAEHISRPAFDLTAAQKLAGELCVKESEIRALYVALLHETGAVVDAATWARLTAEP